MSYKLGKKKAREHIPTKPDGYVDDIIDRIRYSKNSPKLSVAEKKAEKRRLNDAIRKERKEIRLGDKISREISKETRTGSFLVRLKNKQDKKQRQEDKVERAGGVINDGLIRICI